eukprot:1194454-Prorocentrum_minimum.AAC.1
MMFGLVTHDNTQVLQVCGDARRRRPNPRQINHWRACDWAETPSQAPSQQSSARYRWGRLGRRSCSELFRNDRSVQRALFFGSIHRSVEFAITRCATHSSLRVRERLVSFACKTPMRTRFAKGSTCGYTSVARAPVPGSR